jgi:hypothetical protein
MGEGQPSPSLASQQLAFTLEASMARADPPVNGGSSRPPGRRLP